MRKSIFATLLGLLFCSVLFAQSTPTADTAANNVQPSPAVSSLEPAFQEFKIPAGTPIDIQTTDIISSMDTKAGDLISFRVLVPVKVNDRIVIGNNALVTARIVKAKRAGHWGKAGKLAWMMQDVVAVDLTRVSLTANPDFPGGRQGVVGQSHGAEVATKTAVTAALLAPTIIFAPLALMNGFKRGEQAVIPEGRRFVVYVQKDTIVRIPTETRTIRIDR
ncbi:MAG TPA: hypothetical protein VGP81_08530 [Pyrinomonadaceae bacterium]|jgi:hypothetical protein|nr:hypothetical protein [Pyrinomonadaceae bacterium]